MNEQNSSSAPHSSKLERLPSMVALRAFEAAARLGSIKCASEELCVTPAAVSQQIKKLEEELGMALFDREHRRVLLTYQGRELSECLVGAISDIRQTLRRMRSLQVDTEITVAAPPHFSARFIAPRLCTFNMQHPDIDVRLIVGLDPGIYEQSGADIGIQVCASGGEGVTGAKCYWESLAPMATPYYLSEYGIETPEDLYKATLLDYDVRSIFSGAPIWRDWFARARVAMADTQSIVSFGLNYDQVGDAGVNHAGVFLGGRIQGSKFIENGHLVCPFGPEISAGLGFKIISRYQDAFTHPANAFSNWLSEQLETVYSTPIADQVESAALAKQ